MPFKEKFQNLNQSQKRTIYYWASVVLAIDGIVGLQHIINFSQSGMCRSYMVIGSALHSCGAVEFIKNGWAWLTFTNAFVFIPAAAFMIFATFVVDKMFAKEQ